MTDITAPGTFRKCLHHREVCTRGVPLRRALSINKASSVHTATSVWFSAHGHPKTQKVQEALGAYPACEAYP